MGLTNEATTRPHFAAHEPGRFRYLDGVRGLASLQVLVSHCLLAFLPGAVHAVGFVADGDFAVLLFFVMSGFVLTVSFERQRAALPMIVLSRFFRLALPVAAACLIGLLLLLAMPDAHARAAELSGSEFLAGKSIASPLRATVDILGVTMWTGTSNTTLFGFLEHVLPTTENSLDPPIWSMHLELWGSLLVLLLVKASRARPAVARIVLLVAAMLSGVNAITLFICGFLIAHWVRLPTVSRQLLRRGIWVAGVALLIVGVLLAGHSAGRIGGGLDSLSSYSILSPYDWYLPRKSLAALLVFLGILTLPPIQRWLSRPLFEWLGKCSFAIYLLHLPLLMTVGSLTYVAVHEIGQSAAAAMTTLVVVGATFMLASGFEVWFDRPFVNFARWLRAGTASSSAS